MDWHLKREVAEGRGVVFARVGVLLADSFFFSPERELDDGNLSCATGLQVRGGERVGAGGGGRGAGRCGRDAGRQV